MAITTKYDGIEYRSRLEARWAAFMKNIGWDVVYEPFDGDGYIPDFLVQGDQPMLIEVKPAVTQKEYEAAVPKAESGLSAHWRHDILIVGASPYWVSQDGMESDHVAGMLGEFHSFFVREHGAGYYDAADAAMLRAENPDSEVFHWDWDLGRWFACRVCGYVNVFHSVGSFAGRPCGHYDGNGHLGTPPIAVMKSMWADACNDVKWRGRAA